jgi:transcriptional regulator with XRE-family HTH domain
MSAGMTQLEVAKQLGVSRQLVAQIEHKALWKLRQSGKLDKFLTLLEAPIEEYYGEDSSIINKYNGGRF